MFVSCKLRKVTVSLSLTDLMLMFCHFCLFSGLLSHLTYVRHDLFIYLFISLFPLHYLLA